VIIRPARHKKPEDVVRCEWTETTEAAAALIRPESDMESAAIGVRSAWEGIGELLDVIPHVFMGCDRRLLPRWAGQLNGCSERSRPVVQKWWQPQAPQIQDGAAKWSMNARTAGGCGYCIASHGAAAKKAGMTDEMWGEVLAIVGMANETNRLAFGLQVPIDPMFQNAAVSKT
jgi:hypothetical protein